MKINRFMSKRSQLMIALTKEIRNLRINITNLVAVNNILGKRIKTMKTFSVKFYFQRKLRVRLAY